MGRKIKQNPYRRLARSLLKWFRALLRSIFPSGRKVYQGSLTSLKSPQIKIVKPLVDTDYEFLFLQLLEGVANGWDRVRIEKFLSDLHDRTTTDNWINWLHGFGKKLLENPVKNQLLANRMIQLGEIGSGGLEKTSQAIGKKILKQLAEARIKEVNIADVLTVNSYSNPLNSLSEHDNVKAGHILFSNLLKDENLVNVMGNLLPIDNDDVQAEIWFNQGNQQYINRNFLAAVDSYDNVLSIKPNNHDAWYNRALVLTELGRYEEAIANYDAALNIQPNCPDTWNNRGAALRNIERFEEAVTSYDKALELNPENYQIWYNRGISLFKLGRIEEAILSYDRALQLETKSHEVWNNKGNALRELGQYKEAIYCYDKALSIKADKAETWNNRGTALFGLEQFEEAILNYEKALEIKPDLSDSWHNRGNALQKLGREAEAILSYDRACLSSHLLLKAYKI